MYYRSTRHNPYFNRWFSAINFESGIYRKGDLVTILILIDGFLQYGLTGVFNDCYTCHNPYFNRWFSAMIKNV